MIRELRKHFFEKSLRICKYAGRRSRPDPDEVTFQRVLGHERYFAAHFVLQNIAPPAECAGRQHRFGAGHTDLPAHLQIRKLF